MRNAKCPNSKKAVGREGSNSPESHGRQPLSSQVNCTYKPEHTVYNHWKDFVTDVETKDIHKRNVTSEHKNVTVVARKGTLLKYV